MNKYIEWHGLLRGMPVEEHRPSDGVSERSLEFRDAWPFSGKSTSSAKAHASFHLLVDFFV